MRFLCPLVTLILACSAAAADPPLPSENLFPLKIGNTWTYKVANQEDRFVVRAVRQEMIGSQTCMLLEGSLKDRVVATEHVAFLKDGLYRFRVDREDVVPPLCVLRTPLPKKGSWPNLKSEFRLGSRTANAGFFWNKEEVTVAGMKYRTTKVLAGTFEGGRFQPLSDTWYADGVGIVQQRIFPRQLTLELEKFESGNGK
jgi:hypothetical protein